MASRHGQADRVTCDVAYPVTCDVAYPVTCDVADRLTCDVDRDRVPANLSVAKEAYESYQVLFKKFLLFF